MNRHTEAGTPCPTGWGGNIRLSTSGGNVENVGSDDDVCHEDDTAVIDFTTEIRSYPLTKVKPRRVKRTAAFQIHEDEIDGFCFSTNSGAEPSKNPARRKSVNKNSAMLAQPAQRFHRPR